MDRNAHIARGKNEQCGLSRRVGRGQEQQPLGLGGQLLRAPAIARFDPVRQRSVARQAKASGKPVRGGFARQLKQRKRIAPRLGKYPGSTRSSRGAAITDVSNSRDEGSSSPFSRSSGSPANSPSPLESRWANSRTTASAARRRATKASTCAEERSSHCTSSMMQTSGRSSAAADSKLSAASPTRNRSGCAPELRPKAVASASRCGPGKAPPSSRRLPHSCCRPAKGSSISHSTPVARMTRQFSARLTAYSNRADLPIPGSPRTTRTALRPEFAVASSPSSFAHSDPRPASTEACSSDGGFIPRPA